MGKVPDSFPNGIATMWIYVTEDHSRGEQILSTVLGSVLKRPIDEFRRQLPIESPEKCEEILGA